MKSLNRILASAALAAGLTLPALAADNFVINQFTDPSEASSWSRWWGGAVQTYEHDATVDANSDPASGSLKLTAQFDIVAYGGDNQFAAQHYFPSMIDGTQFTNMVFDLLFAPTSPTRSSGDYGNMEFGVIPADYSQILLGTIAVPSTASGWTRVSARMDPTTPKIDQIRGVWVKIWAGDTGAGAVNALTGTSVMWFDNFQLLANTNSAPPPPPSVAIQRAKPGLQLFTTTAGGQYGRQNIYTAGSTGYSWVGAPGPVTYSITIGEYIKSGSGFQTHLFLVPGSGLPTWMNSPDWNQPNLVFLDIGNNADGSGYASFRYKTNLPNGNTMVYGAGTIASIGSSTVTGTWSITFNNNTDITLTAPNGSVTNFAMPADAVALFADPLHVYVGAQPNQTANIGQSVLIQRVRVTGTPTPIDDDFSSGGLNAGPWQIAAADSAGVVVVPPDYPFWLNWTLPDAGFSFEMLTPELGSPILGTPQGLTTPVQIGSRRWSLVPQSLVPFPGEGVFFRLMKPAAAPQ